MAGIYAGHIVFFYDHPPLKKILIMKLLIRFYGSEKMVFDETRQLNNIELVK